MKVLYIVSRFPFPLIKGDKLRAFHQIKELSASCDVYLCALSDEKVPAESIRALEPYCRKIHIYRISPVSIAFNTFWFFVFTGKPVQIGYFYNRWIASRMKKNIENIKPDRIFCQLIRTAEYVRKIRHIPKTLDYMDALSAGMERRAQNASPMVRFMFELEARRLKRYEHLIFGDFERCCIISRSDRNLIFQYKNEDIVILPNGIDGNFFHPLEREKEFDLLFTGNMAYPPNVQSAIYLVRKIMPLVWSKRPETNLLICGANPSGKVKVIRDKKIRVQGSVEDIRQAYSKSKIFVAPMLIGSGMQNKLLEAMSMKMPCVTSELANRALEATEGEEILVGKSDSGYADHIVRLLENGELANRIAEKGHSFVNGHFNWSVSNQILLNLLNANDAAAQI